MEELLSYHQHDSNMAPGAPYYFTSSGKNALQVPEGWRSLYTLKDITECLKKVHPVRYTEAVVKSLLCILTADSFLLTSSRSFLVTVRYYIHPT